jgi:hypothetical protein
VTSVLSTRTGAATQPGRMTRTRLLLALPAALAVLLTGGCSGGGTTSSAGAVSSAPESNPLGDIPDNQVYVPYRPADGSFTVQVPEGWARTDLPDGVSFTDKLNTVSVGELTGRPQTNQDTVLGDELAAIAAAGRNVTPGSVETVALPAGQTVHATFAQDSTPDPVTGRVIRDDAELFVFWRNGTEVLLTLSGPHGADNVDPWKKISTSFSWA